MASAFDQYGKSYQQVVQDSISFSGLEHDFFLTAKVKRLEALFARHFGDKRPALADIGCGVGRMHPLLAPICRTIAGSDPSGDCIAEARIANPAVDYAQADGSTLPWADHSFDAALAVCVFHHVIPAERAALVSEMRRIVRPGGLVVVIEHNPWNPLTRLAVARCPFDHDAVLLDWRNCNRMLAAGGLGSVRSEHFLILPTAHKAAVAVEGAFARLPLGAQYMTAGTV